MIEYRLMEQIPAELICMDSNIYCLEYCSKGADQDKFFTGIPLLVLDEGTYYPVSGKRYIHNYMQKQRSLPYGFIVEKSGAFYELLMSLIQLKAEMKGFNVIEKALALKKLHDIDKNISEDLLKVLQIPKNERYIRGNIALATASERIKEHVLSGEISELTLFEIFQFDKPDWEMMVAFIAKIKLGIKKRNEIVNMIFDIVQKDKRTAREILEGEDIREMLALRMDKPHIGRRIYSYLEDLCHPYISRYKKKFYSKLKQVGLEECFRVKIPQDFESWMFEISFTFSSADDFKRKVELLKDTGAKQSFHELLSLRN